MFRGQSSHLASCRWLVLEVCIFGELFIPLCFPVHFSPLSRHCRRPILLGWLVGKLLLPLWNKCFFFSECPREKRVDWSLKKQAVFRPGIWPLAKADIPRGQFLFGRSLRGGHNARSPIPIYAEGVKLSGIAGVGNLGGFGKPRRIDNIGIMVSQIGV